MVGFDIFLFGSGSEGRANECQAALRRTEVNKL